MDNLVIGDSGRGLSQRSKYVLTKYLGGKQSHLQSLTEHMFTGMSNVLIMDHPRCASGMF